jgi:tetratricopeptide (TPR) repeat protein
VNPIKRSGGKTRILLSSVLLLCSLSLFFSCAGSAASAEEYYNLGMAYFDQKKFDEAEKWLNRARTVDKTRSASDYALGRIAFERADYEAALRHFGKILRADPKNVPALKAAAYTLIKLERLIEAEDYYLRLLDLSPESADNGYSYAVVLFALHKSAEAEELLSRYAAPLSGNRDALLLLARVQRAQDKVEAVDNYQTWLSGGDDARVRWEYARTLEKGGFYARALEEYRHLLQENAASSAPELTRPRLRFDAGRVLLIADPEGDGLTELSGAVTDGFNDQDAMESLLSEPEIGAAQKEEIRRILDTMRQAVAAP